MAPRRAHEMDGMAGGGGWAGADYSTTAVPRPGRCSGLGTVPCGITLSTDAAAHARDGRHGAGGGYWAGVGVSHVLGCALGVSFVRVVRVSPPRRLTRSDISAGGRVGEVRAKLKA